MLKTYYVHVVFPSPPFFANTKMQVLHILLYWKTLPRSGMTWRVIEPELCDTETSSPSSTILLMDRIRILLMASYALWTRNWKSSPRSERIRMVSLTFSEERNVFLFLSSFHFWQLMACENDAFAGQTGKILTSEMFSTPYTQQWDRSFIFIHLSAMSREMHRMGGGL